MGVEIEDMKNLPGVEHRTDNIVKVGQVVAKGLIKSGKAEKFVEALNKKGYGFKKEDLTMSGETALYTTMITNFVERKLRPMLVAAGLIRDIPNFTLRGHDSIKVPIREELITAVDLPDSGDLSYHTDGFTSQTITVAYKHAATKITWELLQHANVDLIAEEVGEIGDALARALDSDIISEFDSAVTSGNDNEVTSSSGMSYELLIDGFVKAWENNARPDAILTNPTTFGKLMKDSTLVTALADATRQGSGVIMPEIENVVNQRVFVSNQVPADTTFLIDRARTGYVLRGAGPVVIDHQRNDSASFGIAGLQGWGIGIIQPKSVTGIRENVSP